MAASCEICGSEIQSGGRIVVDRKILCAGCLELETATCCCCHRRIWQSSNAGNEHTPICQNCREEQNTDCPHCGSLVSIGLSRYPAEGGYGNPHCRGCFERYDQRNYIHNYNHKPTPIFYGEGRRWFGVELEIDDAGQDKFHETIIC